MTRRWRRLPSGHGARCRCKPPTVRCNGACVNTQTDPDHCGDCRVRCTAAPEHATAVCLRGACTFRCDAGFKRCRDRCIPDVAGACCGNAQCASPQTCGGGGVPNVCGCTPEPAATTCGQGTLCGRRTNNCGQPVDCACSATRICNFGQCICVSDTCATADTCTQDESFSELCVDGCCCTNGPGHYQCVPGPNPTCCSGRCGRNQQCIPVA